jgi:phenylalanyl-tRNA synthetase beta chain
MIAPETLACGEVVRVIRAASCPWLENVELFDVFADEKALGPGRKSLAFSLTYRRADRTLTDEEANQAHEAIKAELARQLPVHFR